MEKGKRKRETRAKERGVGRTFLGVKLEAKEADPAAFA